jgi:hypothetical protein
MPLAEQDTSNPQKFRSSGRTGQTTQVCLLLTLRLGLEDENGDPVKTEAVFSMNDSESATPDGDGTVEFHVRSKTGRGQLKVDDPESGFEVDVPVVIGKLPPADQEAGQKVRLRNLGYFFGYVPGVDASDDHDDPQAFASAVEEFQCDHGLSKTGQCDATTQQKLVELHGS